ncbi:MAG: alpha/beta fold hydrolase [Nitrospiraceae bacterium]|nr:MAG: alpha/beta fold hydrolase [Nitrospiraceae bacterium]
MRFPPFPPFDRHPPRFVSVNQHRTAYIRHGQGPPVVLLHGYAGAIWNWEHQIEPLGRRFTLFIPDLIGQGLSDKPRVTYTPAFYTDWLCGFLDAVGVGRAAIVGHSMGAGLALSLALTHPDHVDRLALISGFPRGLLDHIKSSQLRRLHQLGSGWLFGLGYRLLGRRAFRKFIGGLVTDRNLVTPAVIERAYHLRKDCGKARPLWSSIQHVPDWENDYALRLGEVRCPVQIIWGQQDRFIPCSAGEELHQAIPGSRLAVIPDAGHLPMWERPADVNRLITEFLTSLPSLTFTQPGDYTISVPRSLL